MLNLVKTFVLLSTSLIIGCATSSSGKSFDSAIGEWKLQIHAPNGTTYAARLTIIDETKAKYTWSNGRIFFYAIDNPVKWEGYWIEDSGQHDCSEEKNGSTDWGVGSFQFNDAYNRFSGKWDFCGDGDEYDWDGAR